jgi:hypothetical protein
MATKPLQATIAVARRLIWMIAVTCFIIKLFLPWGNYII